MAKPSPSRLGRGLGALITSSAAAPKPAAPAPAPAATPAPVPAPVVVEGLPGYREIPVHHVEPNPYQPRKEFSDEALAELVESIRAEGLLQPIVVRSAGDKFQLIAGERRWRAFQKLGVKSIPARVMNSSDASAATLAMIENLQRADLNPIEEAHGYASLIRDFDLTQDAAAQRVGKGRATVANSLRLLGLEAELQGYVGKGMLSVGHAKVLLGVEGSAERAVLARRTLEQGLSVRALEELLRSHAGGKTGKKRRMPGATATALADIEKKLTSHLGARSSLKHSDKNGRIIIEYAGNDDLARVLGKMGLNL
ncbi:ParB/RepB/Spo0J family partition protein [Oleiharenicola lentus]|jgi:ParB family chromosome partitioning protein|uniref:ParB/RepB/Spo0J family partition protein n=1 Tax=Oleiharenicola lentus TaxID=2508720 RepID=A0A4Q1CAG4_9BACT|nr:ParB/RepB/Spo0J family partition protein [Oleiharenicola lentus]RXK56073.1 ParB/RepB/Spo0J family partition protein [Oleiharenicola lentus]